MSPIYTILIAVLEAIGLFYAFRKKIANANNAVAVKNRTIAEKDRTLAEKDKTIAEMKRCIAETELLGVDVQKARVNLRIDQFVVQDKLTEESQKYKEAQQMLTNALASLTDKCFRKAEASPDREKVIRILVHDVIGSFSSYVNKATIEYKDHSPEIISSYIRSELLPFLGEVISVRDILNNENVLEYCNTSCASFTVTIASLGAIERALIELVPKLPEEHQELLGNAAREEDVAGQFAFFDTILSL